jgi:hypothetical protein
MFGLVHLCGFDMIDAEGGCRAAAEVIGVAKSTHPRSPWRMPACWLSEFTPISHL